MNKKRIKAAFYFMLKQFLYHIGGIVMGIVMFPAWLNLLKLSNLATSTEEQIAVTTLGIWLCLLVIIGMFFDMWMRNFWIEMDGLDG